MPTRGANAAAAATRRIRASAADRAARSAPVTVGRTGSPPTGRTEPAVSLWAHPAAEPLLRRLWLVEAQSFAAIAAALAVATGLPATRGAVAGRLRRMGLLGLQGSERVEAEPPSVRVDAAPAAHRPGTYRLTELRRCQCRFPVTPDGAAAHEHRFCGEAVEAEGKPYCPAHAARCFDRRPETRKAADRQRAAAARLAKAVRRGWGSTGA